MSKPKKDDQKSADDSKSKTNNIYKELLVKKISELAIDLNGNNNTIIDENVEF